MGLPASSQPLSAAATTPLVIVAGPTASGKSALALALARHWQGEIVSFDSMQVYRGFDIGTAKPGAEELAQVPHHFISEADPSEPLTAGEYARRARPRIRAIAARGALPVLVGGTGFYLRALLEGLAPAPPRSVAVRARLRNRAERRGPESLHRLLRRLDPVAAARIAPRDAARSIRALEVRLQSGRPLSEWWRIAAAEPFAGVEPHFLGLNPPRAALYSRIDARAAAMFRTPGLVEETQALLATYPADLAVFEAHGYRQACDVLLRGAPRAQALAAAQQEQRQYAKRQMTWFRREPRMHWLAGFGDDPAIQAEALAWVRRRLGK